MLNCLNPQYLGLVLPFYSILPLFQISGILAVARSLGDHGMKEFVIGKPYISTTEVQIEEMDNASQGQFVIIDCDVLWDVMEDQEAVDLVRKVVQHSKVREFDPLTGDQLSLDQRERAAQALVDESLKRGSTDNVTVIIAWL